MELLDLSVVIKAVDEATAEVGNIASGITGTMGTAAKAAGAAVAVATTAVAGFGAMSVKTGMDFDASMSQVSATLGFATDEIANNVNGAGDTFDALRAKALEMGSSTMYTATQAADGLNTLALSGFDAQESIGMIEDVLHLAGAGSLELADAAAYVSAAMKGFNDETKDSEYYASLMAKGATLANTDVQQLGEALGNSSSSIAGYGQSAEAGTLALLRLAEANETGSAAATALNAVMKDLYTGTDDAKAALEELGVAAYDSAGNARNVNDVVNDLNDALSGMSEEESNAYKQTIFGIQGLKAYNKMVVTSKEKQEEWAEALANSSGEVAKQYDTMTDNLQGDLVTWGSALEGFQIAVSDVLTPTMREFTQFGSGAVQELTTAFREGGVDEAMSVFGDKLSEGLSMVVEKLPGLVTAGASFLGAFLQGVVSSVPTLLTAIVEIGQSLVDMFVEAVQGLPERVHEFFEQLGGQIQEIDLAASLHEVLGSLSSVFNEVAPELIGAVEELFNGIWTIIPELLPQVMSALSELIGAVVAFVLQNAPAFLETVLSLAGTVLQGIIESIPIIIEGITEMIDGLITTIADNAPAMVEEFSTILGGLVDAISENLPNVIATLAGGLLNLVETVLSNAPNLLSAAVQMFGTILTAIVQNAPKIIAGLVSALASLVKTVISHLPQMLTAGATFIGGLVTAIGQAVGKVGSAIGTLVSGAVSKAKSFVGQMLSAGRDIIQGLIDGIKSNIGRVASIITDGIKGAVDAVKSFLGIASPSKLFRQFGEFTMEGFALGINDMTDRAVNAMEQAAKSVYSAASGEIDIYTKTGSYMGLNTHSAAVAGGYGDTYNVYLQIDNPNDFNGMALAFAEAVQTRNRMRGRTSTVNTRMV